MIMARRYPKEFHIFMCEFVPGHTDRETAAEANKRFGYNITPAAVHSYKQNHKLRSGFRKNDKKGRPTKMYPAEVMAYIKENATGVPIAEMAERLNKEFGTSYTYAQLKGHYSAHGITNGMYTKFHKGHIPPNKGKHPGSHPNAIPTQFKKGNIPFNKMPVGTVWKKSDGYLWKKTGEGCRDWKQLHRMIWEDAYGPIPEGKILIFLDGNREHVELSNLAMISNGAQAVMNKLGLRYDDPELTRTGSLIAELKVSIHKKRKKGQSDGAEKQHTAESCDSEQQEGEELEE